MRNVKVPGRNCLSINESDKICFILADDSNSSLTPIYASKTKSALPKSNGNKNQITTANNSPPTSSWTNKNNIKQLTSELGFFFQSDNPTDLRHQETPLAPPKPSWAGGSGDDTWRTWKPWAKRSKRKPWREENGGNIDISQDFLELLGWVASSTCITAGYSRLHILFQIYLLLIQRRVRLPRMEFELQWGFANYMILLVKEVPISHRKHTRYKQSIIRFLYGRWHTEMLCKHAIFNPLPVELENKNSASSAKTEVCTGQPMLSDMPSQCGGFSFLQNKTTDKIT